MALEVSFIKWKTMEGHSESGYAGGSVFDFFAFLCLVSWQSSGLFSTF